MTSRDATELYLADVYAQPLADPEQQLAWTGEIDRAQQQFNQALAAGPEAVGVLLACHADIPPGQGAARILARVLPQDGGAAADTPDACLNGRMRRLRELSLSASRPDTDAILHALRPLRLRTEFAIQLTDLLRARSSADADRFVATATPIQARIAELTGFLVRANQRLVATLARQYRNGPLPFMDLVQEGNIGLLRAIERFDPGHGTRVSTYAMWWIRRAMVYAIARQGRDVRPSVAQYWGARQALRTMDRLENLQGRRATQKETAQHLGTSVSALQQTLAVLLPPLALDAPVGGAEEPRHMERLQAAADKDPEQSIVDGDLRRAVRELLLHLPERHAKILRMRFGIDLRDDCTLDQIAQQQGVTRERIRQLEVQALDALRKLEQTWTLRGCLG
jgi:RNA polymerase sigma factor (sigma-70 family)